MTSEQILEALREILREKLAVDRPVGPATRVVGDLELDSLQRIELVIEVENHFRICLEPEDEEKIETVQDLVRVIEDRQDASRRRSE